MLRAGVKHTRRQGGRSDNQIKVGVRYLESNLLPVDCLCVKPLLNQYYLVCLKVELLIALVCVFQFDKLNMGTCFIRVTLKYSDSSIIK